MLLFLGLFAHRSQAQGGEEIPLHPPVASKDAPLVEEVSYRQNNFDDRGFNRVIPQVAVPTLTVYHPAKSAHRGTAIIICPGGGYGYVVIDREGNAIARYFQAAGHHGNRAEIPFAPAAAGRK